MDQIYQDNTIDAHLEEWFLDFYEEYRDLIYFLVTKRKDPAAEAEDLMQDVLIKLINHCDKLYELQRTAPSQLKIYVASTVNSVCIDWLRTSKADHLVPMSEEDLFQESEAQRIQQHYGQTDTQHALELLKKHLPSRDWKLLKGKYVDGLSHKELSELTGYSYGSARMALSRAKRNARELLKDWWG